MKEIAVIGSGQMGNGIAHVFAQSGYNVTLIDISDEALKKAISTIDKNLERQVAKNLITTEAKSSALNRIKVSSQISEGVKNADLVIEAATERMDLKLQIFSDLDKFCKAECILASNTSSISITRIASATKRTDKVIGMHFMNPVPVMKLVEIIRGYSTSTVTAEMINEIAVKLGKTPVEVNDYPGFVSNRILMPMINESIYTLFEGVAGVMEIDTVMKLGMSHPMGPLQLADFIGLDTCLSILKVLHDGFGNPKYAPCPLLVNMVNAGNYGVKSGSGFYKYTTGSKEITIAANFMK
jgi:3-hydroxybutyryl-CoA dehydrogenase